MLPIAWKLDHPSLLVGVVIADGVTIGETSEDGRLVLDQRRDAAAEVPERTRTAMRTLLKRGGFKPTGRNKPASEYLGEAKKRGEWPRIFNVVDINNLLSLETGWPMSVLDLGKCGDVDLCIRFGAADEKYVFNQAGHAIDLEGLLGVANGQHMLGNPVKDAMHAKVDAETSRVIVLMWSSRDAAAPDQVEAAAKDFAALLVRFAGASATEVAVLSQ